MPLVCMFFGIKIFMYWDDHLPMHFHAEYGDSKALISIRDAVVIKGTLPAKQVKLVLAWCEIHRDELLKNWEAAEQNKPILKIVPLK
jgi:hypothetical protein